MIKGFDLEVLEKSRYSIYALSKELKFIYFNPAWYHFAIENDIDQTAFNNITLGSSYTKSIKVVLLVQSPLLQLVVELHRQYNTHMLIAILMPFLVLERRVLQR